MSDEPSEDKSLMQRARGLMETGPLAWMANNHVASNLLMAVLIAGGLMALPTIRQEVFPEFDLDMVTIAVPYPGASPEEVEQGVVLSVEEAVRGLDGVKEVRAVASEGAGVVTVELLLIACCLTSRVRSIESPRSPRTLSAQWSVWLPSSAACCH